MAKITVEFKVPAEKSPYPLQAKGESDFDYGRRIGRWRRANRLRLAMLDALSRGDDARKQFTRSQRTEIARAFNRGLDGREGA